MSLSIIGCRVRHRMIFILLFFLQFFLLLFLFCFILVRALLIASASCGVSGISLTGLLGVLYPHLEHVTFVYWLVVIRMLLQCWHFTMVFV